MLVYSLSVRLSCRLLLGKIGVLVSPGRYQQCISQRPLRFTLERSVKQVYPLVRLASKESVSQLSVRGLASGEARLVTVGHTSERVRFNCLWLSTSIDRSDRPLSLHIFVYIEVNKVFRLYVHTCII